MNEIEKLKEVGLYKEGDAIIYGVIMPSILDYATYGSFFGTIKRMENFIIIKNEESLIIIPRNKLTNGMNLDKKFAIPLNEIRYFDAKKSGGMIKFSIIGDENKCLFSFLMTRNTTDDIRKNLNILFSNIECKNLENIKPMNKGLITLSIIITLIIFFICVLFSIAEGKYIITVIAVGIIIYILYLVIKNGDSVL